MFDHILVCVDGSLHANAAVQTALELCDAGTNDIELISVVPDDFNWVIGTPMGPVPPASRYEAMERDHRHILNEASSRIPIGIPVKKTLAHGSPADEILGRVARGGVDLVVMGSRGRGNLRALLLGSVSRQVTAESSVPVLVARASRSTIDAAGGSRYYASAA